MSNFELLDHTADVRIKAEGEDMESLFRAALDGLNEVLLPGFKDSGKKENYKINLIIDSDDKTSLLIDFLSDALYETHTKKAIFRIRKIKINGMECEAKLSGWAVKKFDEDVKAVTYNDAEIIKTDETYECVITLDI